MTVRPSELLIREVGDLHLLEAATGGDGPFNPDGTVNVAILRPCKGRGPGSRIYTKEMLREAAQTFTGWPMYVNHDSPAARRARAGLPRPPSELGGEIRESWWDDNYSTPDDSDPELNYLPGAVVGKFMPATREVEEMVRRIPRQIKLSVNATATSLRRATLPEYGEGALVEGIVNDPENSSVDLVTKAGAGGHVRQLLEAVYSGEGDPPRTDPEDDDMKLSEALREPEVVAYLVGQMLESDDGKALIEAAVEERVEQRVSALRAEGDRDAELRRLESKARALIETVRLSDGAKALLVEDYSFGDDDRAGRSLALIEAVTENGAVTKSADDVLKDAIERDAKRLREAVGAAHPTVPFVPGGGNDGGDPTPTPMSPSGTFATTARGMGLDPALFGVPAPKEAAKA